MARVSLAALLLLAAPLAAQQAPSIDEFQVPWERTRPRDPYVDQQGRVWFVGQQGHYVAVFDTTTRQFRRYELEPGTGPHNLIVATDGMVWYAGNLNRHIGRLDPATGQITKYMMPDSMARDPHTLVFDRNGDIWFTVQGGNFIGHLRTRTGEVRLARAESPRSRPYGIRMDPRGERPWVVLFGTNKIATVDPASMRVTEYTIPRPEARPRRLGITSDGAIWYGDYAAGYLGRFDPATQRFEEYPLPSGAASRPYAVMNDADDRIWVVETGVQPNRFVGFDTRTRQYLPASNVPSGGGTVRHMYYDPATRAMWFGADVGTIGRARVPPSTSTIP